MDARLRWAGVHHKISIAPKSGTKTCNDALRGDMVYAS